MATNSNNVSTAKPATAGAVSIVTTAPTDYKTTLTGAKNLGYCGEDGLVNGYARSTQNIKAWGGNIVETSVTEQADTFVLTLIECTNPEVLKSVYGSGNVTETTDMITVNAGKVETDIKIWVVDMLLKNGVRKRQVIPRGIVTNIEDITYNDTTAIGYKITIAALPGSDGYTHHEYIEKKAS